MCGKQSGQYCFSVKMRVNASTTGRRRRKSVSLTDRPLVTSSSSKLGVIMPFASALVAGIGKKLLKKR
jgi:hypothetical protein